ncbi:receptor activity-modifying protein 2 isoform X2 [Austrofundulus limnaeus]|uniref:Receptor activity-modifying protein 2 isoform X2 n=1 Tax=Austrofundulus limnaeus TaxID=52670 RepID=A0A2I4CFQ7_AUSLI|nr:PREDICTED: receptor activity-modifying protein 2 isoform X2 [Austrofundulus limnaeus]
MKGAVGFIGVFLSFLSDVLGDITRTAACLDDSPRCTLVCKICDSYFEDQMTCLSFLFEHNCLPQFNKGMESLNNTDWCVWDKVNSLYSSLSQCTEDISDCLLIPWPNSLVEDIFVSIHSRFFQECSMEEFSDPSPQIVFALVITPICLIPVMVSLVVLKTKNGDGTP